MFHYIIYNIYVTNVRSDIKKMYSRSNVSGVFIEDFTILFCLYGSE